MSYQLITGVQDRAPIDRQNRYTRGDWLRRAELAARGRDIRRAPLVPGHGQQLYWSVRPAGVKRVVAENSAPGPIVSPKLLALRDLRRLPPERA